jgi:hypothetical protein
MKKLFASLMLGFGAALGVFVALAMPPGGWGVAVGVGLGLLGCLPLLLIMMMLVGRGQVDRRTLVYEEAQPQPPVIVIQPPGRYDPFPDYHQGQGRDFRPESGYYPYPVEPVFSRRMSQAALPDYNRLAPANRQPHPRPYYQPEYPLEYQPEYQSEYQPERLAYNSPEYYPAGYAGPSEDEPVYYAAPAPGLPDYAAYYGSYPAQPPAYSQAADEPDRFYPTSNRGPGRLLSRYDEAVEADYRTIGDS